MVRYLLLLLIVIKSGVSATNTVVNVGTSAAGNVAAFSGTDGASVAPSTSLTITSTNAALTGNLTANGAAFTNTVSATGYYTSPGDTYLNAVNGIYFTRAATVTILAGFITSGELTLYGGGSQRVFLSGESAGVMQMGQDSASAVAQTLKGADGSGTDKTGADLTIEGGQGTGTGPGGTLRLRRAPFSTTGSTANTYVDAYIAPPEKTVTDAATSIFEITLPTLKAASVTVKWGLEASDGTDVQAYGGAVQIDVVNKGGVYTKTITAGTESKAISNGSTQTGSWSAVDGTNKVTIQFTPNGSLTETTYKLFFTIENNSRQAIVLL